MRTCDILKSLFAWGPLRSTITLLCPFLAVKRNYTQVAPIVDESEGSSASLLVVIAIIFIVLIILAVLSLLYFLRSKNSSMDRDIAHQMAPQGGGQYLFDTINWYT